MFCRKCGQEIADDAQFCFKCGAATELVGYSEKTENNSDPIYFTERQPIKKEMEPLPPKARHYGERYHCPECKSTNLKCETLYNPTRIYWVCPKCRTRLRDMEEAQEKADAAGAKKRLFFALTFVCIFIGIFSTLLVNILSNLFDMNSDSAFIYTLLLIIPGIIFAILGFLKYKKQKELELEATNSFVYFYED